MQANKHFILPYT